MVHIIEVTPNTPEWLEARNSGIGGSEAAAAIGLSKWDTPLTLWRRKVGIDGGIEQNFAMKMGHLLEPVLRQLYVDETGNEVVVPKCIFQSDKYPWMRTTLDGMTPGTAIMQQLKSTCYPDGWGEPGTDEIPRDYMIQIQHELIVTELEVCHVPLLVYGRKFLMYEVRADKELQELIIQAEHDFWQQVINKTEPAMQGDDADKYFRTSKESTIEATPEILNLVAYVGGFKKGTKEKEQEIDGIINQVKIFMGENDALTCEGRKIATWKTNKASKRFDAERFKADHPELYSQYIKESTPARPFLIK